MSLLMELEQSGFAIQQGVLSSRAVHSALAAIEQFFARQPERSEYGMRHLLQAIPEIYQIVNATAVREVASSMLGPNAFVVRSVFFDKTPEANWKVAWHQDLTISVRERMHVPGFTGWSVKEGVVHVQPPIKVLERMLTMRLHLDDCHAENGPLQVFPGSHRGGRLSASQISAWRQKTRPKVCLV
jgi:ectoine hydroxylase-related dioxygenase (phytanoyl-CoA dioxygenase family)